jgi:hypothetical protein
MPKGKTADCDKNDARERLAQAQAFLEAAEEALAKRAMPQYTVAVSNAVLAGIAASDAICCVRTGRRHRGEDHQGAIVTLTSATPDGKALGQVLARLLSGKTPSQYAGTRMTLDKAKAAARQARLLVERAVEEISR